MIDKAIRAVDGGVIVDIEVVPTAKAPGCAWDPWRNRIKLKISSKAQKGKANGEVVSFLSTLGDARIVSGMHNKEKSIFIGAEYGAVRAFFEVILDRGT